MGRKTKVMPENLVTECMGINESIPSYRGHSLLKTNYNFVRSNFLFLYGILAPKLSMSEYW